MQPPSKLRSLGRSSWRAVLTIAALWLGGESLEAAVGPDVQREHEIKAVFLFNFTRFVDWPMESLSLPPAPFIIGVLGTDPFGSVLDKVVSGEKANDHPLVIKRFRRLQDVDDCHVLFISRSESRNLGAILKELRGRPVLSVSDIEGFAEAGGMIGLVTENGKVRLKVNVDIAKDAQLAISSKLLRPSELVKSPKPKAKWKGRWKRYVDLPGYLRDAEEPVFRVTSGERILRWR